MDKENILKEIEKLFEEEKYSKFQLSDYNLTKFKKIDKLTDAIRENSLESAAVKMASEYLIKNEFSLIAKYIIAYFSFDENHEIFVEGFIKIIKNFIERQKWGIVEFLSNKILSFEENEFGLRSLINSLKMLNKIKDIPELQKKLLILNPEDNTIAISLARYYENKNKKDETVQYYKHALKLFINKKNKKMVEEIWVKILEIMENSLEVYNEIENALKSNFDSVFVISLLSSLVRSLAKLEKYDNVIPLLKNILSLQPTNKEYREELVKIYRLKYKDHSRLEDLLKSSGLRKWWKDINPCIELFEKQIKFDIGVYVSHYSWGTGEITTIDKDQISINFEKKQDHNMSFDMALNTLEIIPEDHIRVKKRNDLDNLKKLANKDPIKLIEMIVNSYSKDEITMDDLKEELTDRIISHSDWQRWSAKIKKILKTYPNFKLFEAEKLIKCIESDTSYGDVILDKFNNVAEFFDKIKIINELLENDINKNVSKDIYQQLCDYLIDFTNNQFESKPELAYISANIISSIKSFYTKVSIKNLNYDHNHIINNMDNIVDLFKNINIPDYRKSLVNDVKKMRKNWDEILFDFLFTEGNKLFDFIIEILTNSNKNELIRKAIDQSIDQYRDYPDLFYYFAKNILSKSMENVITTDFNLLQKIYQNLFFLLSYAGRQMKNKKNTNYYSKIQKQVIRLLLDKSSNYFLNFIKKSVDNNHDISSLINIFMENEYVPKKHRENIVGELRSIEKSIVF